MKTISGQTGMQVDTRFREWIPEKSIENDL